MIECLINNLDNILRWGWIVIFFDLQVMKNIGMNFSAVVMLYITVYSFFYILIYKYLKSNKYIKYFFIFWTIIRPIFGAIFLFFILWILEYIGYFK